jgi:ATP-dependent DNA helicase UvrD/PcrA
MPRGPSRPPVRLHRSTPVTHPAAPLLPTSLQRQAIEAPLGPVLVLAGPGAGKTFCLIERIRFLIERLDFPSERICAVTFTNKAAGEVAARLAGLPGDRAAGVTRSTIHALCVQILREHGEAVGIPRGFGIADEDYQMAVLRRAGFRKDVGWPLRLFSRHRMQGVPLEDWLVTLYQRYREILDARGLLDFDDLVLQTEVLLRTRTEIGDAIAGRWDYLLVDEFQDLNPMQYAILRRLTQGHRNLFGVGDDEQAIYAWAGADLKCLSDFANDFGIRQKAIVLDENRRSSRQIFETARRLVEHNPKLFDKNLRATRESPWPVMVYAFADEEEEGAWIVDDIRRDRDQSGLPWGEYAVLYRRHETGDQLETRLLQAGIPCQLAQGRALGDDPVVRYLLAALRVIAAPADPIPAEQFAAVVLPRTLYSTLRAEADRRDRPLLELLRLEGRRLPRRDEDGKKIRRCLVTLANLPAMRDRHLRLAALVEELLAQRVGQYRSFLEEKYEESLIGDPLEDSAATALRDRLRRALHGRATVWLPRLGGAELALGVMLREAGVTQVGYLDPGAVPRPDDVRIGPTDRGRHSLALTLFKALQLIHAAELEPAFLDFVAVDVETTDLDPETCDVVELAAVRVRQGRIVEEFRRLVRPTRPVSPAAAAVHHYTEAQLLDAPDFGSVWGEFRAFAGRDLLVAHNGHSFDFPVLRRLAAGHPAGDHFAGFDTLPLARDLHPGSRRLGDLARALGVDPGEEHHALDDTRTLARVLPLLEKKKLARARATALTTLLEHLAVAQVLSPEAELSEEDRSFLDVGRIYALGRYSRALAAFEAERSLSGTTDAPDPERLIERLGGRVLMQRLRREKTAEDRYPAAMSRLRRLLEDGGADATLDEELAGFLERVALSQSRGGPEVDRDRVNLLTLHSTKGLEFSRVYIVGVEDAQLPGAAPGKEPGTHDLEEGRRLLYVGMTRAKDRLVLTRVAMRGEREGGGSRFLEEMGLAAEPMISGPV